jgi:hypothetical protein
MGVGVSGDGREDVVHPRHSLALIKTAWAVRRGQGVLKGFRVTTTRLFWAATTRFSRGPPAGFVGTQRNCWRFEEVGKPLIFVSFLKVAWGVRWRVAIGMRRRSKLQGSSQDRMIGSPRNGRSKAQNWQFTKRRACQPTQQMARATQLHPPTHDKMVLRSHLTNPPSLLLP